MRISLQVSLKFVPRVRINNITALFQIMAWRRTGAKTLSEPMMVRLPTHICAIRPQSVQRHLTCSHALSRHWLLKIRMNGTTCEKSVLNRTLNYAFIGITCHRWQESVAKVTQNQLRNLSRIQPWRCVVRNGLHKYRNFINEVSPIITGDNWWHFIDKVSIFLWLLLSCGGL